MSIFTHLAISPSPSLSQFPSRYAIRAGRNLPDKEFRYLRTIHLIANMLLTTLCLHRDWTISSSLIILYGMTEVWRIVSEDSFVGISQYPLGSIFVYVHDPDLISHVIQ